MAVGNLFLDMAPLRRYPEFRRSFVGLTATSIGTQVGTVAIAYQVYRLTRSDLDVGLISLVQLVPAFFGSIFGGAIADAVDRRRVLLYTSAAMAACAVGLALNSLAHRPSLAAIYLISAANAAVAGADGPTRMALLVSIVDRGDIVAANALRQLLQQVSVVVGPSLGGLLLATGVAPAYWLNVSTIVLAFFATLTVARRPPASARGTFGVRSVVEGLVFVRARQAILGCFAADFNAMVLGMPTALFPALGLLHFHGGAATVGYLYSAPGVGALIATVFSGWALRVNRLGVAVCGAVAVWGAAIALFGLMRSLPLALTLLGVAGAADVVSALFRSTILQVEAPNELRGRISSLHTAVVSAGPRLGNLEAGGVAAAFGTTLSVVSGGIGCVVGIALIARSMPRFLAYDLREHQSEDHIAVTQ